MNARFSKLSYGFLAAGFVLSLAAVGCGDDDSGSGGSGGSSGSAGSSTAGKSGSGGGAAGKSGSGGAGGAPSAAMCITATTAIVKTSQPAACISCACNADAKTILSCDGPCWAVIQCAATKCAGLSGAAAMNCAISMCTTEIGKAGATAANGTPVGAILQGSKCAASCPAMMSGEDGGVDAGN